MTANLYCFFAWTFAWLPATCFLLEHSAATSDSVREIVFSHKHQQNLNYNLDFAITYLCGFFVTFLKFTFLICEIHGRIGIISNFDILWLSNLVWTLVYLHYPCQSQYIVIEYSRYILVSVFVFPLECFLAIYFSVLTFLYNPFHPFFLVGWFLIIPVHIYFFVFWISTESLMLLIGIL